MAEQKQVQMTSNRMARPPLQRPAAVQQALTPKEIFGMLRRHILLIILMTFTGFILAGVSWYLMLRYFPRYTARTAIKVLPPVEKDPTTIISIQVNKDIQYGHRLSIAGRIKQQNSLVELIKRVNVQETAWFSQFGGTKDKRLKKAFKDLKKHFGAHPQRDGDSIILSMSCRNAEESAKIVNEMVSWFLATQKHVVQSEVGNRLAQLANQLNAVEKEISIADNALDQIRTQYKVYDLDKYTSFEHTITKRLNDLEKQEIKLSIDLSRLAGNIDAFDRQAKGPVNVQVENMIELDPTMIMLANQFALLQTRLSSTRTKFGDEHRVIREIKESIREIQETRRLRKTEIAEQTRQSNLKNAQDRFIIMQSEYDEMIRLREVAIARKTDLDRGRIQFQTRKTIKDERQIMLDSIKEQIEKLRMMHEDPETPKVMFMGSAPVPLEISSPKWQIYFPGGIVLGLMLGIGLAFLIEILNDLVRTPSDISRYLHIPLLGIIPHAEEDNHTHKTDIDLFQIVREAPYSVISESYRRFRTNIKLADSSNHSKTFLVSSGAAGDGKTTVAANLATSFIAENKRVLLIDANFWQPNLHKIFSSNNKQNNSDDQSVFGLSNLLNGHCTIEDVIVHSGNEGLDIIEAGQSPSNPAELLGSQNMKKLLAQQKERYDYVIVDGPPVLLVSDTKMLARFVDATILVFNANATRRGAAIRSIREFRQVNATIAGCILFAVKALKGGYFAEQFRSYQQYQKLQLAHAT